MAVSFDWSSRGTIVASFGNELVLWEPPAELTNVFHYKNITAVAYNTNGDLMATGATGTRHTEWIKIWNLTDTRLKLIAHQTVSVDNKITCIDWFYKKKIVVLGMELGSLMIYDFTDLLKQSIRMYMNRHKFRLTQVKFSPTNSFLASCDVSGTVIIWKWNSGRMLKHVVWNFYVKGVCIDWHPWSHANILIGRSYLI